MSSVSDLEHLMRQDHIQHLQKCTWHNIKLCPICNSIEEIYTQNGYGYKNFKHILTKNNIAQKC